MVRDPIPALTRCPPSEPPTAGALHLSHHPSSSAGGLRGSPGRRLSSHGASRPIPLAFSLALQGFPGSRCPSGPWAPGRTLLKSNPAPLLSQDEGEAGVLRSHNFSSPPPPNPSQLSRAHAPPAPALSPTPRSRLPRGPHKALGSPAAESHRCHALGPCALSRAPCAFPSAPQQGWQKEEAGLIKASPGGGGASPQAASFSRPGSPRRGGDRATASQRVRPGAAAAAGTRSSASTRLWGQTLFSSSVELRLVRQRRPYPLPAPPRHRYPVGAAA